MKCGKNDMSDILLALARKHVVNPPKEYFEGLVWDNKPRLDTWLTYYLGAEEQPARYLQLVGSKWLIGAVSRIYSPGCKFDNVLILEGEQYLGKSTVFDRLATINGQRYFTDESVDFKNKDSLMKLQGKLIYEMAELASFRKAETDEIKGFVRRQVDEYRPPFMRKVTPRPRMFIIGGSVNPSAGYFTDPTGNSRYWPVACGATIDIQALDNDKEQLWAEAVARYKQGEKSWLVGDEYIAAQQEQKDRMVEDLMTDKICKVARDLIDSCWTKDFFISDLLMKLDIPILHQDGKLRLRITDVLTANGFVEYKPRVDGGQKRKWKSRQFTSST
jgi:putative DNA primase/helicase